MPQAKVRSWLLVILVVLAAASMFPSFGGSSRPSVPPAHRTDLAAKHPGTRTAEPAPHTPPLRSRR